MRGHSLVTYDKAFRPASRALSGQRGSALLAQLYRSGRSRRSRVIAWLFLEYKHLQDPDTLSVIKTLDAHIGVVIRVYEAALPPYFKEAETLLKAQRRPTLIATSAGNNWPGFGQHYPRWQRPSARHRQRMLSMSVHNACEAVRARRAGADIVFISPVYPTKSHPGRAHLGLFRARVLARLVGKEAFALGGVSHRNISTLNTGFAGVAAISALLKDF